MAKKKSERDNPTILQVCYKLTLTQPLLGTQPLNSKLYSDYVAAKCPENAEEELECLHPLEEIGTGFPRERDIPFLWDYQIKGFFKDACQMLARADGTVSSKLTAYKKKIDGLLFVKPRKILLTLAGPVYIIERPLRAQTAQGERIALARSEAVPAGTSLKFNLKIYGDEITEDHLTEWLEYGEDRGLGCWRNAGWGSFTRELLS